MQAVSRRPPAIAVGTVQEFVSYPDPPMGRIGLSIGDSPQMQLRRVVTANDDCERVVESEWGHHFDAELLVVFLPHGLKYAGALLPLLQGLLKDRGKGRAGVFGIQVELSS